MPPSQPNPSLEDDIYYELPDLPSLEGDDDASEELTTFEIPTLLEDPNGNALDDQEAADLALGEFIQPLSTRDSFGLDDDPIAIAESWDEHDFQPLNPDWLTTPDEAEPFDNPQEGWELGDEEPLSDEEHPDREDSLHHLMG